MKQTLARESRFETVLPLNPPQLAVRPGLLRPFHCPLCKSGRESWHFEAETFGSGPFEKDLFSVYRCGVCHIGITDPVPCEQDSRLLYEDRTSNDFQSDNSSAASALKNLVAGHDVRAFLGGAPLRRPGLKLLDYACGNGSFALAMRRAMNHSEVWACDYHNEAPPLLLNSAVHYVGYQHVKEHGPFDVILCRHVLEHTYDPVKFLHTLCDLMTPGALLIIEVPNLDAPFRQVFGKYWDGFYVPYHPIHFSAAALRRAAAEAGLVVDKEGGCEMPKIGRSLRNLIGCEYNHFLFAAGILLHPAQSVAGMLTGEPTCLRLWVRKQ